MVDKRVAQLAAARDSGLRERTPSRLNRRYAALIGLLFTGLALSVSPPLAAAQDGENAEYKQVVREALEEFNRGNWSEASALFERAHRIQPSARTLRGMGLTAYEDRRYVDAIRHLKAALADTRRPLTAGQTQEVNNTLERAKRFVSHLQLKVTPRSAQVRINGREAEPDETGDVPTDPGLLEVEIAAEDFVPELRRVRVTAGAREVLEIALRPVQGEAPAGGATSAAVPVPTPVPGKPVDEGGSALTTAKWVVGGVALAGLITGGIFIAIQKANADEYHTQCELLVNLDQPCQQLHRDLNPGGKYWTMPIVAFSVGGGLAAVAAVLFIVDAANSDSSSARLAMPERGQAQRATCGVGPGELGVACQLRF